MPKPRGKAKRYGPTPNLKFAGLTIEEIVIAAWCPDKEAKEPPTQVHMKITVQGLEDFPFVVRFLSPDTLGFFIEELARYRKEVWPDAERVNIAMPGDLPSSN